MGGGSKKAKEKVPSVPSQDLSQYCRQKISIVYKASKGSKKVKERVPSGDGKSTSGKFFCNYSSCKKWFSTMHYTCEACQIHCNHKLAYDQHLKGKGHLKSANLKTPNEDTKLAVDASKENSTASKDSKETASKDSKETTSNDSKETTSNDSKETISKDSKEIASKDSKETASKDSKAKEE